MGAHGTPHKFPTRMADAGSDAGTDAVVDAGNMAVVVLEKEKTTCCICLEAEDVDTVVFLPCRCRVKLCDACCAAVTQCVYHRAGGEQSRDHFVTEIVRLRRVVENLAQLNMSANRRLHESAPLVLRAKLVKIHILQLSLIWTAAFFLHHVAFDALHDRVLANVLAAAALCTNVWFLGKHEYLSCTARSIMRRIFVIAVACGLAMYVALVHFHVLSNGWVLE
jgi:hypothetical protein